MPAKLNGGGGVNAPTWEIVDLAFRQFLTVPQDGSPRGIFFKPDGTKMYVVGQTNDRVYEYDLGTTWDISTAVFLQFFSVAVQDVTPTAIFFRSDGLKMYVIGQTNDRVYEYDLTVAWDISTAVFLQFFSVAAQDISPTGLFFKPDGLKMYVLGNSADRVYEYNLGTAWNISTAVFLQFFSVAAQDNGVVSLSFKPDGTKMYVLGAAAPNKVIQYDLSTAWNVSTAVFNKILAIAGNITPSGIYIPDSGVYMFISSNVAVSVMRYGWT